MIVFTNTCKHVVVFTIYMYVVFYLLNDWLEHIRNAAFTGRRNVKVVQFVFGWVFKSIMYHVRYSKFAFQV